jgi:hypothetical protein
MGSIVESWSSDVVRDGVEFGNHETGLVPLLVREPKISRRSGAPAKLEFNRRR